MPPPSGAFRPTNADDSGDGGGTDAFAAPAPIPSGNAALSVFDGSDPAGRWKLFARTDARASGGGIAGGWKHCIQAKIKKRKH